MDRGESVSPGYDVSVPFLSCPVMAVSPQDGSLRSAGHGDRTHGPEMSSQQRGQPSPVDINKHQAESPE